MVTVKDVDEDDNENLATSIVALMQKDTRLKRVQNNGEQAEEFIQIRIYKVITLIAFKSGKE